MANAVIGQLVETPLFLERELGLLRGNVMHLEMSVNQMFMMRPSLDMGDYAARSKALPHRRQHPSRRRHHGRRGGTQPRWC
ncbi:MAG: hypothetical protein R2873_13770 [Caldilineaceae bacterium]